MLEIFGYILISLLITFHLYCVYHYANKLKLQNEEKTKEQRDKIHKEELNKGFKLYEWIGKFNYTSYKQGKTKSGRGYFKNQQELSNWLKTRKLSLEYCREI